MSGSGDNTIPNKGVRDVGLSPLAFLASHALGEINSELGKYLRIGSDLVSLMMLLSRVAGRLGLPFNLVIYSDDPGAEHLIADRLINLSPESVKRVETIKQFRQLVDLEFENTELVIVRSLHQELVRYACESTCRDTSTASVPSIWLITDQVTSIPKIGPTLELRATQTDRALSGFGHHFSPAVDDNQSQSLKALRRILLGLKSQPPRQCAFQQSVRAELAPAQMLIANRLMAAVAALRIAWQHENGKYLTDSELSITIEDYKVTRDLLISLPLPSEHSGLCPYATKTAENLYEATAGDPRYQATLPDNSSFGKHSFTRRQAEQITGLSYNTVKRHLANLEDEGIVESLVLGPSQKHARIRRQGKQIHFRFQKSRSPPFTKDSPFNCLPEADEITSDCDS